MFSTWLSAASFIGVLAAIGLAFHSNMIARDTAKRELRAYINVAYAEVEPPESPLNFKARIHFENFGMTPAYDVQSRVNSRTVGGGVLDSFSRELSHREPSPPFVAAPRRQFSRTVDVILDPEELDSLESGIAHAIIYGDVTYGDAFGQPRTTTFCMRVFHFRKPNEKIVPWGNGDSAT